LASATTSSTSVASKRRSHALAIGSFPASSPIWSARSRRGAASGRFAAGGGQNLLHAHAFAARCDLFRCGGGWLCFSRGASELARSGENVGVLLPNAVGLPITLLGLNAYDRVAAVLNFSAGKRALTSAIGTAQLRIVLTSKRFVEAGGFEELIAALAAAFLAQRGIVGEVAGGLLDAPCDFVGEAHPQGLPSSCTGSASPSGL